MERRAISIAGQSALRRQRQRSTRSHQRQRQRKAVGKGVTKQKKGQRRTKKRGEGIVSARARRAQTALRVKIEKDAEPVGHKAQKQSPQQRQGGRQALAQQQRHAQRPKPRAEALTITISKGSLPEILRVQLFSNPQQTQASSTSGEPREKDRLDASSKESSALASVTNAMASQSRLLMGSRKSRSAMRAVATISKLLSRAAFDAVVSESPVMRKIGAAMSSATMPAV